MNPADTTSDRIHRGSSWADFMPKWARAARRTTEDPANEMEGAGFRTHLPGRTPRTEVSP